MAFKPAAGYGDLFSVSVADIRGAGFEIPRMGGTVLRRAIDFLVFTRFLNASRDSFGKGKGGTFTVPIALDFGQPGAVSALTAGTAIGVGSQTWDKVTMTLNEYGTGVGRERFVDFISNIDDQREVVDTLGRHIGRMINRLDYDVFSGGNFSIEVPSTGSYSNLLGTNRALVGTAYGELGPGGVALAYDSLRSSLVPAVTDSGLYVWIASSDTLRPLKAGSAFTNQALWWKLSGLTYQVLGEFGGFVFVETYEQMSKGTSFAFGKNVGGYGFGETPRTYYYPDYGSDAARLAVWKTIFLRGQGAILRDKGTASIMVRSRTAAYNYGSMG